MPTIFAATNEHEADVQMLIERDNVGIVESKVAYGIKSLIMLVALAEQPGWAKRSFSCLFFTQAFCTYWEERSVCVIVLAIDINLEDYGTCDSSGSVTVTFCFIYLIVLYRGVLFPTLQYQC